jgi:small-conductance mechanosensitive channel
MDNSLTTNLQTSLERFAASVGHLVWMLFANPVSRTTTIIVWSLLLGLLLRWVCGKWLARLAQTTEGVYDDIIVEALRRTVVYIALLVGVNVAVRELPAAMRIVLAPYSRPIINTGIIVVITFLVAQVVRQVFKTRAASEDSRIAAMSLTRRIVEFVTYIVGGVMILRTFGVDVTAIVTALGVGGLAVALALQDTLSNAFAGVYITLARQLRKGDYIKTNDNFEGFVQDIGWRNTTIETLEHSIVFIPNNKLSQAIVTNFFLPKEVVYARVALGVHYDTDPEHLERVLKSIVLEAAHHDYHAAHSTTQPDGKIRGVMALPEPAVRFTAFGDYTLNFVLWFAVNTFDNQFSARHEIMKRIYYKLREENIAIPMPIRVLYTAPDFSADDALSPTRASGVSPLGVSPLGASPISDGFVARKPH